MNKKLAALAVAGVFAAPLAAQAQTANVTLYGRVHATYEWVKGDRNDTSEWFDRVNANSSRIGVKGEEKLGAMTAIFQIESSVSTDSGGGTLGGRDTFVGLKGAFGTVRIGNMLAPYDDLHPVFGNTVALLTSDLSMASLWANATLPKGSGGFDARLGNSIRYDLPAIGGLRGGIQYSLVNSSQENPNKGEVVSGSIGWTGGIFNVMAGWEYDNDQRAASTTDQAYGIAAAVDLKVVRLAAVWDRTDYDGAGANFKRDFWAITGKGQLGGFELYAAYGWAGDNKGSGSISGGASNGVLLSTGSDTGAQQYQVTAGYKLSKRTGMYLGYHAINNDDNANYTFNINPVQTSAGKTVQTITFGVYHLF